MPGHQTFTVLFSFQRDFLDVPWQFPMRMRIACWMLPAREQVRGTFYADCVCFSVDRGKLVGLEKLSA